MPKKEFLNRHEKISTNILADRLNKLVESGLASTSPSRLINGRDAYVLTDKGKSLGPLLSFIKDWGIRNIEHTQALLIKSSEKAHHR